MIRTFKKTEVSQLHEMIHETIDVSYPPYYSDRAVQFFKEYHSEANIIKRSQHGELIIIENEGEILATGSLVGNEILGVFVLPNRQRGGLGKQIMLELESRAKKKGISEINLDVSLPSRKFYEKLNYEISEPHQINVGEGQQLEYWQGKKKINS